MSIRQNYANYFKLETINSVGHFIPEEVPTEVLKVILHFFESNILDSIERRYSRLVYFTIIGN